MTWINFYGIFFIFYLNVKKKVSLLLFRGGGGAREERTEMGLVKGHAYGVTALKKVPIGSSGLSSLFK